MMKKFTTGPYEGFQVNETGTIVISPSGRTLKITLKKGYKKKNFTDRIVVMCNNINGHNTTYQVSRLVACAFVPNPDNKTYVIHKDGNFKNVYFKNLEWATSRERHINNVANGKYKIEPFCFRKETTADNIKKSVIDHGNNFKNQLDFPVMNIHPTKGILVSVFD